MELVADANVLIDYAKTDPSILALFVRHLGAIYVPSVILDEVDQLDAADCDRLGLTLAEEPVETLTDAAADTRGPLSFEDRVCLLMASNNGWTCVTNEKPLHRACDQAEVAHIWGLRIMIELVATEQLPLNSAMEVAQAIQSINPRYITPAILERFEHEIRQYK